MLKTVYKIRRKSDGMYSKGGAWPSFSKKGKTWPSPGALHSHLNMVSQNRMTTDYGDCEVVAIEIETIEREVTGTEVIQYQRDRMKKLHDERAEKERKRQARIPKCPTCSHPLHGAH